MIPARSPEGSAAGEPRGEAATIRRRLRVPRRGPASDPAIELAMRVLDGARSGRPGPVALVEAVQAVDPSRTSLGARRAAVELTSGRPAPAAIGDWQRLSSTPTERLLATAILVSTNHGGSPAASIATALALARDGSSVEARRRALLAPARATTAVLVVLPILFAAFASILSGGIIYRGAVGVALLVTGAALDLIGLLWMTRLQMRFGR